MPERTCTIEGCDRAARKRGWCVSHHARWKRHGNTDAAVPIRPIVRWNDTPLLGNRDTGCWLWPGVLDKDGYGQVWWAERTGRTHRLVYEAIYGPIPPGMHVRHRCDTPACCNPDHLQLGTAAENIADKVGKDRQAKGEAHGMVKLTEDDVRTIRRERAAGVTLVVLAERFGVSLTTVSRIHHRRIWRHVAA